MSLDIEVKQNEKPSDSSDCSDSNPENENKIFSEEIWYKSRKTTIEFLMKKIQPVNTRKKFEARDES